MEGTKTRMMTVVIREPYWGAWSKYGWEKGIPGVGISESYVMHAVRNKESLTVKINKDPKTYEISGKDIVLLAKKYKSIMVLKNNVKVAVVPISELKEVEYKEEKPKYEFIED